MAFTNETTHYGLPQWIGSDKPTYLVDQNDAYQKIDSEIYNANVAAGEAVTTANGAASTAAGAASTAAGAVETAQAAQTTATAADGKADTAITQSQAAQTAAGAAQTAAAAAQEAAAGNSITNLAPAYDPTITYAVDDLVTAEGKLYICITAVTTPEQFDINKWDDVSTTQVYARGNVSYTKAQSDDRYILNVNNKYRLSHRHTFRFEPENGETYGQMLTRLHSATPFSGLADNQTAQLNSIFINDYNLVASYPLLYSQSSAMGDIDASTIVDIASDTGIVAMCLRIFSSWCHLSKAVIASNGTVSITDLTSQPAAAMYINCTIYTAS